jgi:hypothetical protein
VVDRIRRFVGMRANLYYNSAEGLNVGTSVPLVLGSQS